MVVYRAGEVGTIPRAMVEQAFQSLIYQPDADGWGLTLPDYGPCDATMSVGDKPDIGYFSINRPPDDPAFWDALFDLMSRTPTALAWPSAEPWMFVANAAVLAELPASVLEALGDVPPANSAEELRAHVHAAW